MLREYGIGISDQVQANASGLLLAVDQVKDLYPGGAAVEQTTGVLTSDQMPSVSGHRATVVRIDGAAALGPGGTPPPDGLASVPDRTLATCTVTIFDADTGEFLVSMQDARPL
jgi:hypothetical protein